jgi:hypothetical protein
LFFDTNPIIPGFTDTYENIIDTIRNVNSPLITDGNYAAYQAMRIKLMRGILERSFVKSLGDYLQELSTVADNGGYVVGTSTRPTDVIPPNEGRLGLHNDRPAAARAILLSLYGKSGINPMSVSGLVVTDAQDKLNYIVAGRSMKIVRGGRIRKITKYNDCKNKTKKKSKQIKQNTKRISKIRLNKSKRKSVKKATKTSFRK